MGRLGALHNLFSVCLASTPKSGTLVTPHQSSLSSLFAQQPKDPVHTSLLVKHLWTAAKTLQGQTKSDQHIFLPSCHRHHQLCYWVFLASNTQIAPFHKENPSVKPFPKPKCPCTWSTSKPRALWLHMQNLRIREVAYLGIPGALLAPSCLTAVLLWHRCSKVWQAYYTPCPGIFWFPAGSECPALKSRTANHLDASTIKCSGKQVRLKIHCNKHLKICLLSQVWKARAAGTLKYSCSEGSLKIPDLLLCGNIVSRDNQPVWPLLHWIGCTISFSGKYCFTFRYFVQSMNG